MSGLDLALGLDLTVRLVACGLVISALEMLTRLTDFRPGGVFDAAVISSLHSRTDVLERTDPFLGGLLGIQAGVALGLAAMGPFSVGGRWLLAAALAVTLVVRWRRHLGGDGAEQMAMLALLAAGLAVLPNPSPTRVGIAVWFLAAQLCLSYFAAGVAKLVSPLWRSGEALPRILSTYSHGHPWAAELLLKHRWLARAGCWTVILFECSFPFLLLGPAWLVIAALLLGFGFHLACAVFMGLNSFLWSFPGIYPCVLAAWLIWRG